MAKKKEGAPKAKTMSDLLAKYGATEKTLYMSTGSVSMDDVLGGGLGCPKRKMIEIYSQNGMGKSTLCAHWAKHLYETTGQKTAYIDIEKGGLSESLRDSMEIPPDALIHVYPTHHKDVEEIMPSLIAHKEDIGLVVFDSITALMPDAMMEMAVADFVKTPGIKARYDSALVQKLKEWCNARDWSFILLEQMRMKINLFGPSYEDSAAGNTIRFYVDIRVAMKRDETIESAGDHVGNVLEVQAVKNRWAKPFRVKKLHVLFGRGISNAWTIIDDLQDLKVITKSGAFYLVQIPGLEKNVQGKIPLYDYMVENWDIVVKYHTEHKGELELS